MNVGKITLEFIKDPTTGKDGVTTSVEVESADTEAIVNMIEQLAKVQVALFESMRPNLITKIPIRSREPQDKSANVDA